MSVRLDTGVSLVRLVALDRKIDGAESDAIRARWEFGRETLALRIGNKLPDGILDMICQETKKSRSEIKYRMLFAKKFTEKSLVNAVDQHRSWHEIVNVDLGHIYDRPLPPMVQQWANQSDGVATTKPRPAPKPRRRHGCAADSQQIANRLAVLSLDIGESRSNLVHGSTDEQWAEIVSYVKDIWDNVNAIGEERRRYAAGEPFGIGGPIRFRELAGAEAGE